MADRTRAKRVGLFAGIVAVVAVATALVVWLLMNISERKREGRSPFLRVVNVDEVTTDPAVWGKNWPMEFDSYQRTADVTRTKYGGSGGSEALPQQKIERDPWLKRMFAGYAFSIDYRDRRGHAYMLYDQEQTERVTKKPQPGACVHCHASAAPTWRRLGLEAEGKTLADAAPGFDWPHVMEGFKKMSAMTYTEAHAELLKTPDGSPDEATPSPGGSSVTTKTPANAAGVPKGAPTTKEALATQAGEAHPVACIDCHNPETMQLRVTRPGFVNGIAALAKSSEPVPHIPSIQRWREGGKAEPYDPNVDATRQEMRSFVCGQCHVEYYCGPKETLFFPWGNGLKVEQIEAYYDAHKFPDGHRFYDYQHAETGAEVLKAQHPEFELWSQGIHARSGVACADCHMPYQRVGAQKVSDHWVRSPLLNINRACQTCHRFPESEIQARVEAIQGRNFELLQRSGKALTDLMDAVVAAKKGGAGEEQLKDALAMQRKAQWRLDFVAAENSMGFHASQETARILAESIDYARQGEISARRAGSAQVK